MEDSLRGHAKPKKLRVRFPDGTVYCYSSVKETFLEALRKIDPNKLYELKMEVCHLPMFTRLVKDTAYELYKDFMEPIGNGWYVNTQGDTYNKYVQLKNINEQLNLGLEIDLSEDFKGEKVARGSKGMAVLEVTFPDHTVIGEENTNETFMQCIWHLGVESVKFFDKKNTVGGVPRGEQRKIYDQRRRYVLPKYGIDLVEISYSDFGASKKLKRNETHDLEIVKRLLSKFYNYESLQQESQKNSKNNICTGCHSVFNIFHYDSSNYMVARSV